MSNLKRFTQAIADADEYMMKHHNHMLDAAECIAVIQVMEVLISLAPRWVNPWRKDTPTRRGPYPVMSEGAKKPNYGWRYWRGPEKGWGPLCSRRSWCIGTRDNEWRRTPVKHPILWFDDALANSTVKYPYPKFLHKRG